MEILAYSIAELWTQWLWPILLLVVGIGLVIFVHELGHFLMAKAVGIKVERFAVGIGWRLFGVKIGGTDCCIKALPIGGYVKMLGQEDFARLDEAQGRPDPGSYAAKPISARLAVISAGVVMNIIFSAGLFIVICLIGKQFYAPVVGGVASGFPASQAEITWQDDSAVGRPATQGLAERGLRPGDRVLSVQGDGWLLNLVGMPVTRFSDMMMIAVLADTDDEFLFTIEREVGGRKRIGTATLGVALNPDTQRLAFGIEPARTTTIRKVEGAVASGFPASQAEITWEGDSAVSRPATQGLAERGLRPGDRVLSVEGAVADRHFRAGDNVTAINGQPIRHGWDIGTVLRTLDGNQVTVTVQRQEGQKLVSRDIVLHPILGHSNKVHWLKDGRRIRGQVVNAWREEKKVLLALQAEDGGRITICRDDLATPFLDLLGMMPRLRIVKVKSGSPAHKCGLEPDDIILAYGDNHLPTFDVFRRITTEVVNQGTDITVLRRGEAMSFRIIPKMVKKTAVVGATISADLANCVVAEVRKNSAADKAGILAGATVTAVNGRPVKSWLDLYVALRARAGKSVSIGFRYGAREDTARIGRLTTGLLDPADYRFGVFPAGVAFERLTVRIVKSNPVEAMGWGCKETVRIILATYMSLRSMARRTVPVEDAVGPVGIGSIAIGAARESPMDFVYFIAFLSAAIAVFNFLPLPVLDGGHAVLLIIENIRGRPLSVRALNIIQTAGLVLIFGILVAVTFNDIYRIIDESW